MLPLPGFRVSTVLAAFTTLNCNVYMLRLTNYLDTRQIFQALRLIFEIRVNSKLQWPKVLDIKLPVEYITRALAVPRKVDVIQTAGWIFLLKHILFMLYILFHLTRPSTADPAIMILNMDCKTKLIFEGPVSLHKKTGRRHRKCT